MKLGSLFDGIGGFPLAASMHSIEPVWASEIETFPIEVTKMRFPNMKHLGDITQINGAEIEPVDIITFGSPCQRLSTAGRHDGFNITFTCVGTKNNPHDTYVKKIRATDKYQYLYTNTCSVCGTELTETNESALFFHAIRIIGEMRNATANEYPRFILWENVPGAFSSNGGQDFRAVIKEIAESEIPMPKSGRWATAGMVRGQKYSIAWRVLDAQYFGAPQRRKRIFLVCDFAGQRAGEILFESEGLSRDTAESRKAWEKVAAGAGDGIKSTEYQWGQGDRIGGWVEREDRIFAYQSDKKRSTVQEHIYHKENGVSDSLTQQKQYVIVPDIAPTVTAKWAKGTRGPAGDECQNLVAIAPFNTGQITSPQNGNKVEFGLPCHTLSSNEHPPSVIISYGIQGSMIGRADKNGPQGDGVNEDVSFTLNTTDRHAVVYGICSYSSNSMKSNNPHSGIYEAKTSRTLDLNGGNPACNQGGIMIVNEKEQTCFNETGFAKFKEGCGTLRASGGDNGGGSENLIQQNYTVRRLTVIECLRLQGFPDWWFDGVPGYSDTQGYKTTGNSVAIPCVAWLMWQIARRYRNGQAPLP